MLHIYDSLSRQKRPFEPIRPKKVSLYVCGITVYDLCHVGHARSLLVFDTIVRVLRFLDYSVTYVRNITDIDDKIIQRALDNKEPWRDLVDRMIDAMHADEHALGLLPPNHEPLATDHIDGMLSLIQSLEKKGLAYQTESGDVCFSVEDYAEYGALSHRVLDELQAGARVVDQSGKRHPHDFVLWKHAKPDEPAWESPYGPGRPGWHIECSAMSTKHLGQPFDIHGGGMDLKFPHHENEIAQSQGACDKTYANYWMHSGLLTINGEKMSKSLGNFVTIRDALAEHEAEVIRYLMLASHYRSPVNYSTDQLDQAKASLKRLYIALRDVTCVEIPDEQLKASEWYQRFVEALFDDINVPEALAVLFALAKEVNRARDANPDELVTLASLLHQLGAVLGLLQQDPALFLKGQLPAGLDEATIESMLADRRLAREKKEWAKADSIRDELLEKGIEIEDRGNDTGWKVV